MTQFTASAKTEFDDGDADHRPAHRRERPTRPRFAPESTIDMVARRLDAMNLPGMTAFFTLMSRAGIDVEQVVPRSPSPQSQALRDIAMIGVNRMKNAALTEIGDTVLQSEGTCSRNTLEAAGNMTMSAAIADVFELSANTALIAGFRGSPFIGRGWVMERDIDNFRPVELRGVALGRLQHVQRPGSAVRLDVHGALNENYSALRYGGKAGVSEQDLLDDNVGAVFDVPRQMGEIASELRSDLVASMLLRNPSLTTDDVTVFHADHNNTGTEAMDTDAIGSAMSAIADQRLTVGDGNRALNLRMSHLIVPSALEVTTRKTVNDIWSDANDRPFVIGDTRLGVTGVQDPTTGTVWAGTAVQWFAAAGRSNRTIEIGYVRGQREPRIRMWNMKNGEFGIGFDVSYDLGAGFVGYEGLYRSTGTT